MGQRSRVEKRLKQVVAAHPSLQQAAKWTQKLVSAGAIERAREARTAREAERARRLLLDPFFSDKLRSIDAELGKNPEADIPQLFASIPLDVFALLLFERPSEYPNLNSFFPRMASEERQREWVGNAGLPLMLESTAFIRTVTEKVAKHVHTPLALSNVLDYGFGWGRLLRLMHKYVPERQLYGFDPWQPIVAEARSLGVRGNLEVVPEYPSELPGPKFNLIYAFSIFTHLSERCHLAVLGAFHGALADDGIVVLTVRPSSYWQHKKRPTTPELERSMRETGFAFDPHAKLKPAPDGEVPYGDTTISPSYVAQHWQQFELLDVDVDGLSPEQIILVLRKRRPSA